MAKITKYKTRSETGATILGVLFMLFVPLLIGTPCLALVGTLFGQVTPPKSSHEVLEVVVMLGVCLVMAVALLGLAVLCLNATLLPKTLHVTDDVAPTFLVQETDRRSPFWQPQGSDRSDTGHGRPDG